MTEDDATAETGDDGDGETVRCWLVERTFDDRNLVTLVYATPDGDRYRRKERSAASLGGDAAATAAVDLPTDALEPVTDAATRERYASEAARVADSHEPDEPI
ncbi:hypothetical protein [Halovivax cerinus]|uniref:DUF7967 domain-containing protein n=1 Tax=Halovivax cerinus TaxID=1487865 RepID=A0ABD5NQP3_9EURY|nr:hypothetical protein [Halovivax cerinus]